VHNKKLQKLALVTLAVLILHHYLPKPASCPFELRILY
jgi:hypothetical protein